MRLQLEPFSIKRLQFRAVSYKAAPIGAILKRLKLETP
jgi:hypothetical protein